MNSWFIYHGIRDFPSNAIFYTVVNIFIVDVLSKFQIYEYHVNVYRQNTVAKNNLAAAWEINNVSHRKTYNHAQFIVI